jgi:hypothetical protein
MNPSVCAPRKPRLSALYPPACLIFIALVVSYPLLEKGFFKLEGDARLHVLWSTAFLNQFASGDIYPRWLSAMNDGLGSPTFYFYAPLPYWITAVAGIALPTGSSLSPIAIAAAIGLAGSALTFYVSSLRSCSWQVAFCTAIGYMLAPYHLAIDLLQRCAFGEFWAFVWLPLAIASVLQCFTLAPGAVHRLALAFAALMLTHLLTSLMFCTLLALLPLALIRESNRVAILLRIGGGITLGALMSMFYWLPAISFQKWITPDDWIRFYDYTKSFLTFDGLRYSQFRRELLASLVSAVGVGFCALLAIPRKSVTSSLFWCITSLTFSVMMCFRGSWLIWHVVSPLKILQFPWRFITIATVLAWLLCTQAARFADTRSRRSFLIAAVSLGLTSSLIWTGTIWMSWFHSNDRVTLSSLSDAPEYRPQSVCMELAQVVTVEGFSSGKALCSVEGEQFATFEVLEATHRRIAVSVASSTNVVVRFRKLSFPTWRAFVNSSEVPCVASFPEGLATVAVPGGTNVVELRLLLTTLEERALWISAITLVAMIALWGVSRLRRRSGSYEP